MFRGEEFDRRVAEMRDAAPNVAALLASVGDDSTPEAKAAFHLGNVVVELLAGAMLAPHTALVSMEADMARALMAADGILEGVYDLVP